MRNDLYPSGTVQALLLTDLVKQNTSTILQNRLEKVETQVPLFFDPIAFKTLRAVCMRLIPQPNDSFEKIDLAGMFDEQMASSNGNGWRYNDMPPDDKAFMLGLNGIDETSELMFGGVFTTLQEVEQEELLMEIQSGAPKGNTWQQMPPNLFFEELLCALVELYYSHPIAKDEIGEVAFADAKGWQQIGLNELEAQEPRHINE